MANSPTLYFSVSRMCEVVVPRMYSLLSLWRVRYPSSMPLLFGRRTLLPVWTGLENAEAWNEIAGVVNLNGEEGRRSAMSNEGLASSRMLVIRT